MQVRDVMTEATVTDTPTDNLRTAAERMWREQTGSLLVTQDGRLIGIITERDVLRAVALGADPDRATVDEAMTVGQVFLELMQSKGQGEPDEDVLEDAVAFAGVSKYPARIKCALLGWMAWKDATAQALDEETRLSS